MIAIYINIYTFSQQIREDYYKPINGKPSISLAPTLLRPKSKGTITLRSKNPYDVAIIDPNFLEHQDDVEFFVRGKSMPGVKILR